LIFFALRPPRQSRPQSLIYVKGKDPPTIAENGLLQAPRFRLFIGTEVPADKKRIRFVDYTPP
jgi:hypothetical protein